MKEVLTSKGWENLDTEDPDVLDGVTCCDCKRDPATEISDDDFSVLWAQCEGCAEETQAENQGARDQARYECEGDFR